MRWLGLLLLAGAPALACAQGLEVSGRVVDARTGAALARATVSLDPLAEAGMPGASGNAVEQTTGTDGSFRFAGLAAGRYRLSGSRRGYISAAYQEHDDYFAAMIVGAGVSGATGVRLRLEPFGAVAGTVRDSSGDPVETANVTLFAPAADGSGKVVARGTRFLSNGSPRFEFGNLPPGTYFLAVTARPWYAEPAQGGTPSTLDVAYPLTFFDGADSSAAAQPIVLRAGETAEAPIILHAVPAVHVEVPPQGGGGFQFPALTQGAFGDSLAVNAGMWGSRGSFRGGMQGPMTLSIAPGSYTVQRGGRSAALEVRGDVTLPSAERAPAPVSLSGKLAMADGNRLPSGMTLRFVPEGNRGRFGGRPRRFAGFGQRPVELAVGADGSFHTDAAPEGEYRLEVSGPGTWAVTGAAASGGAVSEDLTLRVGGDAVMLAATVAAADGAVSGRVAGGEPGAMVLVVPETGPAAVLGREDESDSDGTWTVRGMTPGAYRVVAVREGWDLAWKRPEVLPRYLREAVAVTVPAHGRVTVQAPVPAQAR